MQAEAFPPAIGDAVRNFLAANLSHYATLASVPRA